MIGRARRISDFGETDWVDFEVCVECEERDVREECDVRVEADDSDKLPISHDLSECTEALRLEENTIESVADTLEALSLPTDS
mmetsp:Transcript_27962/g.47242  ORF Transcript_27962/g.47242 Transcript_27962/m.47242 type:complete len:83 (-) Transcript_27962:1167-1415(-)